MRASRWEDAATLADRVFLSHAGKDHHHRGGVEGGGGADDAERAARATSAAAATAAVAGIALEAPSDDDDDDEDPGESGWTLVVDEIVGTRAEATKRAALAAVADAVFSSSDAPAAAADGGGGRGAIAAALFTIDEERLDANLSRGERAFVDGVRELLRARDARAAADAIAGSGGDEDADAHARRDASWAAAEDHAREALVAADTAVAETDIEIADDRQRNASVRHFSFFAPQKSNARRAVTAERRSRV